MRSGGGVTATHPVSLKVAILVVVLALLVPFCLSRAGGHDPDAVRLPSSKDSPAVGCTAFVLRHGGRVLVGKNLDWFLGDGVVLANPRGVKKEGCVADGEAPASWVSRHASLTFNQLGREFPLGGMNEAGLVVEELSYGPARYPPADGRPALSELQWIQYQLDTHATVGDVVADTTVRVSALLFGLHYLVADAAGDVAVIEFLDGDRVVHVGSGLPVEVLANDTYGNLLRYLGLHVGFGGDRVVGLGPESPERFVRAATAVRRLEGRGRSGVTFDSAFTVLDDVAQEDTQWSIVYDPVRLEVRYRSRANPWIRSVDVGQFPGDCADAPPGLPIHEAAAPGQTWGPWDGERNTLLVNGVFDALARVLDEPPSTRVRAAMAAHAATLTCARRPKMIR